MSTPAETTASTPAVEPTPAVAATEPVAAAEPAAAAADAAAPAAAAETEEEKVEQADSTAEYAALVQLKPIEVLTGEENEEVIYKQSVNQRERRGRPKREAS